MSAETAESLLLVGALAILGTVAIVARRLRLANEPLSDRADGDWPAVPRDLKVSHSLGDTQ